MDKKEAQALLEYIDDIRQRAGMEPLSEVSRRDVLKGMGAGAAAAAVPGGAEAEWAHRKFGWGQEFWNQGAVTNMTLRDVQEVFDAVDHSLGALDKILEKHGHTSAGRDLDSYIRRGTGGRSIIEVLKGFDSIKNQILVILSQNLK